MDSENIGIDEHFIKNKEKIFSRLKELPEGTFRTEEGRVRTKEFNDKEAVQIDIHVRMPFYVNFPKGSTNQHSSFEDDYSKSSFDYNGIEYTISYSPSFAP